MEHKADDLRGMGVPEAKEYIFHHIAALKVTEKQYQALEDELAQWRGCIELARSRAREDLALEAEAEYARIQERRNALGLEIETLKGSIEGMRGQLPGLAARERSVDPDLLEQELLIALGRLPGEPDAGESTAAAINRISIDAELEALKARMAGGKGGPS